MADRRIALFDSMIASLLAISSLKNPADVSSPTTDAFAVFGFSSKSSTTRLDATAAGRLEGAASEGCMLFAGMEFNNKDMCCMCKGDGDLQDFVFFGTGSESSLSESSSIGDFSLWRFSAAVVALEFSDTLFVRGEVLGGSRMLIEASRSV